MGRRNLVFLTGVILDEVTLSHESGEVKFYSFKLETNVNDNVDTVSCIASDSHYETLMQCYESGTAVTVSGSIRSISKESKRNDIYVFCNDVMMAMPFVDDENSVIADGSVMGNVKIYANRTVVFLKLPVNGYKWAFAIAVGYNNVGRRLALLNTYDEVSLTGHVSASADGVCQIVVEDFEKKGAREHENFKSRRTELQGERAVRGESEQSVSNGMRNKPQWKNDSRRRAVRYSDRQDVRRNFSGQRQTYGRAWE